MWIWKIDNVQILTLISVMFASLLRNFNTFLVKIPRPIMNPVLYLFRFSFLHETPWLQSLHPFLEEKLRCVLTSCLLCNKGIKTPISPLIDIAGSNRVSQCIRNPGKSNEEVVSIVLFWKFGGNLGIAPNEWKHHGEKSHYKGLNNWKASTCCH